MSEPSGDAQSSHLHWRQVLLAERGLLLVWQGPTAVATAAISQLTHTLTGATPLGVVDLVPGIDSLLICYDPTIQSPVDLATSVQPLLHETPSTSVGTGTVHEIAVTYGGEAGPDLADVATACGLSPADVVALHTSTAMPVLMLGFMPGFPYIGGLPPTLHLPRRSTPRTSVPAGSIAIANNQTGIYPNRSPGGWHIIGRTDVTLFDPLRDPPAMIAAGDRVRFIAVES